MRAGGVERDDPDAQAKFRKALQNNSAYANFARVLEQELGFCPLKEFQVYKGLGQGSTEKLPFPHYMLYSKRFYESSWGLSQCRRLRNVVCVLDWIPRVHGVEKNADPKTVQHMLSAPKRRELRADQVAVIRQAFDVLDYDNSGAISLEELRGLLRAIDITDEGEVEEIFAEIREEAAAPETGDHHHAAGREESTGAEKGPGIWGW